MAVTTQEGGALCLHELFRSPVVTVQDAGGNTVTTDTSTVTVAIQNNAGPGGVLSGTLTQQAVAGVADRSEERREGKERGTGYTLNANEGGMSRPISTAFNIT